MKQICSFALGLALAVPTLAGAQAAPAATDVYHIHFTKAVPGQATALGEELKKPNPSAPMPDHALVLRHQEGDDWDYCVISHYGPKAVVDATPMGPNPARAMRAWHTDSFVSGPSWAEFVKAMGIGDGAAGTVGSVYNVQVWRENPGHREQLERAVRQANTGAKIPVSRVVFQHVEGGPWTFVAVDRYNSWQDFGADQAAATSGRAWADLREHSTYHHDTLADRISQR